MGAKVTLLKNNNRTGYFQNSFKTVKDIKKWSIIVNGKIEMMTKDEFQFDLNLAQELFDTDIEYEGGPSCLLQ